MKHKKKILIDAISLLSPHTGIARYTYEVSKALQKSTKDFYNLYFDYGLHSNELISIHNYTTKSNILSSIKQIIISNHILKKFIRQTLQLIAKYTSPTYDLYWQPNFIPNPYIKAKKTITTVHDFSFYLQPNWHPKERIEYFNQYFWKQTTKSDHIITGSDFSKQEIIKYLKYPDKKISVIYHGINHDTYKLYPDFTLLETKNRYKLHDKFILCVGSLEPRKNLINLIKAYSKLPMEIKETYQLLLVGFRGWENKNIKDILEQEKNHIRYIGYVSDKELAHIYNMASLFVYPSLYEGFGLPPLEAMACGCAVIASDTSSIPEICQDNALYIDPLSITDILDKLIYALTNPHIVKRLKTKGLKHAKKFSWDKSAQEHLKIFDKVIDNENRYST